jgi:hypothetical protein
MPKEVPHVPLYARLPSALQASSQSRTFVVPAVVQMVIDPSPLHCASVPEQGGKQVLSTVDVEDVRAAQLAPASASAQVPVTRMAVNWRRHVSVVTAWPHSVISRLQSFSASIGLRVFAPPPEEEPPLLDELDEVDELDELVDDPVPG